MFVDTPWPDFDRRHLWAACVVYAQRNRRFGAAGPVEAPRGRMISVTHFRADGRTSPSARPRGAGRAGGASRLRARHARPQHRRRRRVGAAHRMGERRLLPPRARQLRGQAARHAAAGRGARPAERVRGVAGRRSGRDARSHTRATAHEAASRPDAWVTAECRARARAGRRSRSGPRVRVWTSTNGIPYLRSDLLLWLAIGLLACSIGKRNVLSSCSTSCRSRWC